MEMNLIIGSKLITRCFIKILMQIIIIIITMIMMILMFGSRLHLKSKKKVPGLNKINGTRVEML
jgi:hypothetical protein